MKIIKKNGWSVQVTCTGLGNGSVGCGARLEVEREDLKFCAEKGMYRPSAWSFRCPRVLAAYRSHS